MWVYVRLNDRNRCRLSNRLFFRSEIVIILIVIVHQRFQHLSYLVPILFRLFIQHLSRRSCDPENFNPALPYWWRGWVTQPVERWVSCCIDRGRSVVSISRNTPRRFPKPQRKPAFSIFTFQNQKNASYIIWRITKRRLVCGWRAQRSGSAKHPVFSRDVDNRRF